MVIMSGFDLGSESVSRAVRDLHYTIRSQLAISRYVSVSVPINNVASSPARTPLNHSQTSCTSVSPRTLWVVGPARSTADTRRSSTQRSTRASGGRCSLSSISRVSHRRLVRRVGISPPHCTHVRPQSRKMRFARVLFWYPFKESPADLHREAKHATAEWRQSRWKVQKHNFTRWIMILRPSKRIQLMHPCPYACGPSRRSLRPRPVIQLRLPLLQALHRLQQRSRPCGLDVRLELKRIDLSLP